MFLLGATDGSALRGGGPPPGPPLIGLKLWLDAAQGVSIVGGGVDTWADQSGIGNGVSAALTRPSLTASVINGLPGVTWSSAAVLVGAGTLVAHDAARQISVVCRPAPGGEYVAGGGPAIQIPNLAGSGPAFELVFASDGTSTYVYSDEATADTAIAGAPAIANINFFIELAGATGTGNGKLTCSLNGVAQTLTATNKLTETAASGFTVGASNGLGTGQYFSGSICEILVHDHVLSGPETVQLRTYIESKYAIPLGAP